MATSSLSNPPPETYASATHPADLTFSHTQSYATFIDRAKEAFQGAFPKEQNPRYTEAYVLLLHWVGDDLGVRNDIYALQRVFKDCYNFKTTIWPIPDIDPLEELNIEVNRFKKTNEAPDHLLIIYYGGHSEENPLPGECIWRCSAKPESAGLDWNLIQPFLLKASSDVLILLDCCFAANGARGTGNGTNEIITACSAESRAIGVSRNSFTSVMTRELESLAHAYSKEGIRFTAVALHSTIIRYNRELKFTPFYARLTDHECNSIDLTPLPVAEKLSLTMPGAFPSVPIKFKSSTANPGTRVVLAVHLSQKPTGRLIGFLRGDTHIPEYVVGIEILKVEAAFGSHSSLLIVSVPTYIWCLLPDDPACIFLGFITSSNLCNATTRREQQEVLRRVSALGRGLLSPTTQLKKIMIAGTTGLDLCIAQNIEKDTCYQVMLLSETPRADLTSQGWKVVMVSIEDQDRLEEVLAGVDTIISTNSTDAEETLLCAAANVNVRRFAHVQPEACPTLLGKPACVQLNGMAYTTFTCGILYECFAPGGISGSATGIVFNMDSEHGLITAEKNYIVDMQRMQAYLPCQTSPSDTYICMTSVNDIGRFIGFSLDLPHWPPVVGLCSERMNVENIVRLAEDITGQTFSRTIYHIQDLQAALTQAEKLEDFQRQTLLNSLIATAMGKFDYSTAMLNDFVNIQPQGFKNWLRDAWREHFFHGQSGRGPLIDRDLFKRRTDTTNIQD